MQDFHTQTEESITTDDELPHANDDTITDFTRVKVMAWCPRARLAGKVTALF
jgi:hypothetical protein